MLGTCGFFFEVVDAVEDLVFQRQLDRLTVGKDAFDVLVKILPLPLAPEVIHHHEPAVQQVAAQGGHFVLVSYRPPGSIM